MHATPQRSGAVDAEQIALALAARASRRQEQVKDNAHGAILVARPWAGLICA
jgi:hypothetical protein